MSPRQRARAQRLVLATLLAAALGPGLGGCSKPERVPTGELSLEQFTEGLLTLPADAVLLGSGNMGAPSDPDAAGRSWAWVIGASGSFELAVGRPTAGKLVVQAKASAAFEGEPLDVTARLDGVELGSASLGAQPAELEFDVPEGVLSRPGRVRVELVPSRTVRPSEIVEGSTDGRELSLQIAGARLVADDRPAPAPAQRNARLEPGEVALRELLVREDTRLTWDLGSEPGEGELWVGLRDLETGQLVSWRDVTPGPEAFDLTPDLNELAGRRVELSFLWTGSSALDLRAIDYAPGGTGTNVVLIVIDTLRADHTFGDIPGLETPHLARLRADGHTFDRTYSHAPMTLPSHTSLFSSRYPQVSGVTNNWQPVDEDLPLLADWLAGAGYSCFASISLGTLWSPLPGALLSRGFEEYHAEPEIERADEANELKALPLLERASESQPFFLFCHYSDPHEPYNTARYPDRTAEVRLPGREPFEVPVGTWSREVYELDLEPGEQRVELSAERGVYLRRLAPKVDGAKLDVRFEVGGLRQKAPEHAAVFNVPGREARRVELEVWIYDALDIKEAPEHYKEEVAFADAAVGRILARLDELELYDSSLIVFTSDHGESLLEHGHLGHARHLYDSEIHVPLVIKPPTEAARGSDLRGSSAGVARHIDVVPTILDLLEIAGLPGSMGTSLLDPEPRRHFAETHQPESPEDLYALRDGEFKLIYAPAAERFELYDVNADPKELRDLWSERGGEFAEWREELELLASGHVSGSIDDMDEETRERLRSLGYLPEEGE